MNAHNRIIDKSICIFDSGIGGLNVLHECVRRMPHLDYTYVADNYNVPYGNKTEEELMELTLTAFDKIAQSNPLAVVIACNTVTTRCIGSLRDRYPFKIIGMQPAIKQGGSAGKRCLLLCTRSTANSNNLRQLAQDCKCKSLTVVPQDELAEYIERNVLNLDERVIKSLLPNGKYDTVVLGCTHYVYAAKIIAKHYNLPVFDGIAGTVNHFCKVLGNFDHKIENKGKITFFGGDFEKNRQIFKFLQK